MDENSAAIESFLRDEAEGIHTRNGKDFGWQQVSNKRNRKHSKQPTGRSSDIETLPANANGSAAVDDVFLSIELHAEERHRRTVESQMSAVAVESGGGSKRHSDDDNSGAEHSSTAPENGWGEVKEVKSKKPKKPKVTVAEAAAKISADGLSVFLIETTASYESQQDIQLMRFADYFGRAFASVLTAQFPWLKIFKESTVTKMVNIPLCHIPHDVYKTSVDWIGQRSSDALQSFVLWLLDLILADLAFHQVATKGSKKIAQQAPAKSQVAIFTVLAMVLQRKPDVALGLLPLMRETPKYQGQDKLLVAVWMIAQASVGDLVVGLYMCMHLLLPLLGNKSSNNPQSRDLILQLVERIIGSPKARPILLNGAVRKGEHIVPPSALELLMRVAFPAPANRVKATERFEAVYPILKEIALAGSPGSKTMKSTAQQIFSSSVKAVGEGIPELSKEACDIIVWCLTQNPAECCKQWDAVYLDNLKASAIILRKICDERKAHSSNRATVDHLRETLQSFRQKNERELAKGEDSSSHASIKEADKFCKAILGRFSRRHQCLKDVVFVSAIMAVSAVIFTQNILSWDLRKLSDMFIPSA